MNKQDVFVLNRAIDGKQIYGMPDFANMNISTLLVDVYKEGMIRRGILADKGNLTLEGARIVSCMKEYKESKKYISFNNVVIGKKDTGKAITLLYNPLYDEYKFVRTKLTDGYDDILELYPFFENIEESKKILVREMNFDEYKSEYGDAKKNILNLKVYEDEVEKVFVLFVRNGKAFLYCKNDGYLFIVGKNEIIDLIKGELQ